ncbi:hypothetical protein ACED27_22845 [Vibrio sp. FF112]
MGQKRVSDDWFKGVIGLKVHAGCYMLACRVSMKPTEQSGVSWFCHKSS